MFFFKLENGNNNIDITQLTNFLNAIENTDSNSRLMDLVTQLEDTIKQKNILENEVIKLKEEIKDLNNKIEQNNETLIKEEAEIVELNLQLKINNNDYILSVFNEDILKEITSQKWDCILVNLDLNYDKLRNYLDVAWENLVLDGVMVIESELSQHTSRATQDFLKIIQRDYVVFDTRYKVIVVTK